MSRDKPHITHFLLVVCTNTAPCPSHVGRVVFCSQLPSEEHVGIVQQFKEVQCLSRCQTRHFRSVLVWVVLSGHFSVSYLCLNF